jgi:hypothetical protein
VTLKALGEQLEAHIRLEERRVFPFIEETLPEHALKEVTSRLESLQTVTDPMVGHARGPILIACSHDGRVDKADGTTGRLERSRK